MASALWTVVIALSWICISFTRAEYYSYDGRGNNLEHADWGAANSPFIRKQVQTISYGDGRETLAGASRPSAREITMRLQPRGGRPQPSNTRRLTDMVTYLGQFFDHEFDLRAESQEEAMPIPVPACDMKWDRACHGNATISFYRSDYAKNISGPRQQINTVTSYLDGSVVYGSSEERAMQLRTHVKGRMATSGGLLPDNLLGIPMGGTASYGKLKAAGDVRANVHPPMLALQTLFVREHNRLAAKIYEENPIWSDEHIFQEARKFTIAYMQSICFHEYLPMLGIALDPYQGYQSHVDASVDNFFAAVSYRYGHSEVNEILFRIDEDGWEIADGHLLLSQAYFTPKTTLNNGIEPILRGLCMKIQAEVDTYFASSITHYLFGTPMHGAVDLISTDIQRGRDHGIPDYNTARIELGLAEVLSFDEITSDVFTRRVLEELYGEVDNVDAYVGGMAEDHIPETNLGSLFYASLKEQYQRLRDGDRLFYENRENRLFTDEQIDEIKATGLRDIILRNTDIQYLPENIFIVENAEAHWPKGLTAEEVPDTDPATVSTTETTLTLSDDYVLTYWLEEDTAHFRLRGATEGWMALGFEGPGGGMIDADIIICSVQSGQAELRDSWSTTFAEPTLDEASGGTSDVTLHEFSETNGVSEVHFSRLIETGDASDRIINKDQPTNIIFAWGSTDLLSYHGVSNRGKSSILVNDRSFTLPSRTLFLFKVTSPVAPEEAETSPNSVAPIGGSLSLANGDYELTWSVKTSESGRRLVQESAQRVLFTVKLKGEGWLGFGLAGAAGGMTDADIVIAHMDETGNCDVSDYWSSSFSKPSKDTELGGTDDVQDISCSRENGMTEISFSKLISSSDTNDNSFNVEGITNIIYAYDLASDSLAYHAGNRGSAVLESATEPIPSDTETASDAPSSSMEDGDLIFGQSSLGAFTLLWAISGDELIVKMQTDSDVWVGIGLEPEDGGMVNSDMYLGYNDGSMKVIDCWSSGYSQPSEDSANGGSTSFVDSGASVQDGIYEYWFKRKLDTGDDQDKVVEDKTIDLVYAWGSTPTLGYHGPSQRALASINFATIDGVSTVMDLSRTMIRSHGGIMIISWSVLGLFGSGIARFGRGWKYWLKAHRLLQIGTTVLALIGEVIGFSYTKGSFRTAHSITALCVVFVTFPQVSLGAAAMKKSGSVHYSKLHKGTGYFLIGLASWQIWTGLLTLEIGNRLRRLFVAWIAAWFLAFHFSSMKATTRETEALFKHATLPGEAKDKRSRAASRVENIAEDNTEEKADGKKPMNARKSMMDQIGRTSRGSEMIELLIKGGSSDETDAESDASSMGATAWSESVAGGLGEEGGVTSDTFFMSIQEGNLWTIINDVVYDLTSYIHEHPGGSKVMEDIVGLDGTDSFLEAHGDDRTVLKVLAGLTVGELNDDAGILDSQNEGDNASFVLNEMGGNTAGHSLENEDLVSRSTSSASDHAAPLMKTESLISFEVGLSRREWRSFRIQNLDQLSHDVLLFRMHIPGDDGIDFPMTSHLMIRGTDPSTEKTVARCFTPLVPDQTEHFNKLDILVKCYDDGRMSRYMRARKAGDALEMKGPMRGLKVERGAWQRLGLIGGGSGITPLWQVIDGLLGNPEDATQICLLYQNRYEEDILLRQQLDTLAARHPSRFKVVYILSKPSEGWDGLSGRLDASVLEMHLPRADVPGSFVMVCGPPGLNKSVAGEVDPETEQRRDGILQQLGYTQEMIHVF